MKLYFLPAGSPYPSGHPTISDAHYFVFDDGAMMGMALMYDREIEVEMVRERVKSYTEDQLRNPPFLLSVYRFDDFAEYMEEVPIDAGTTDQN
jgi:hypothetical protein